MGTLAARHPACHSVLPLINERWPRIRRIQRRARERHSGLVGRRGRPWTRYSASRRIPRRPSQGCIVPMRTRTTTILEATAVPVKDHHHEVGAGGQCEIETPMMRGAVATGDMIMKVKYVTKKVAHAAGKTASSMPKPLHAKRGTECTFTSSFSRRERTSSVIRMAMDTSAKTGSSPSRGCCGGAGVFWPSPSVHKLRPVLGARI